MEAIVDRLRGPSLSELQAAPAVAADFTGIVYDHVRGSHELDAAVAQLTDRQVQVCDVV